MEAATWVGPNIMRTSKALGLRTEASARFEKQLHPEQAIAAQRLAARLMVELCGARLVPGTLDEYPKPLQPHEVALRPERMERLLGERIAGRRRRGDPRRGSGSRRGRATPVHVTVPPWRDSDVQREADLIEEVARIHGLDKLPTTLPRAARAPWAGSPGASGCAGGWRTRCATAACTRRSPTASPRPRRSSGCAWRTVPPLRLENPLSEEQSVMRPLLLPGLLDAAATTPPTGGPRAACSSPRTSTGPPGRSTRPAPDSPGGATPAAERHHLGVLLTEAAPGGWRAPALPADFFAARALVEALLEAAGVEWAPAEAAAAVPASRAGRRRCWPASARSAGSASCTRWWPAPGTWPARWPPSSSTLDALAELAEQRTERLPRRDELPRRAARTSPWWCRRTCPPPRWSARCAPAAASCSTRLAVFDLYRGEQVGEGEQVAGAAARVPRARPHAHRRGGGRAARRDRGASWREIGGRLRA